MIKYGKNDKMWQKNDKIWQKNEEYGKRMKNGKNDKRWHLHCTSFHSHLFQNDVPCPPP